MKRMRIITVITCLVIICICAVISFFGMKKDQKMRTIKVGFVYDGDESAPYTYNFIKAQRKIETGDYGGRVMTVAKTNVSEEKSEEAIRALVEEGCDLIITTSYGYGKAAKKLAKEFPNVQFCQATCDNAIEDPLQLSHLHG